MTRPRKVKIRWPDGSTREATVGPDVDLETEIVLDSRGRRIDDAYVEGALADALAKVGRGRPSLTGERANSPQVTFRLTPELRAKAEQRAAAEGKRVSEIAREALEHYVAHG